MSVCMCVNYFSPSYQVAMEFDFVTCDCTVCVAILPQ